jgi:hypothetical protein
MDATIISQFHPDYLTVVSEPDTLAKLTGYSQLNDPAGLASFVQYLLHGLKRGTTKVGAGSGTWTSPTFIQALMKAGLIDFVDLHVYPYSQTTYNNLVSMIDSARQYKKQVVINELWLYKTSGPTSFSNNTNVFRNDNFDFWLPLDQEFLKEIVRIADIKGLVYISPFWTYLFFANVPYDQTTDTLSYGQLSRLVRRSALQNAELGTFSPLGQYYQQLITANR